jgi:GxxExxY protein
MHENELATKVIGFSIDIHRTLGPGLLENAYEECLFYKLGINGFRVEKQKAMPLVFEGVKLDAGYRIDLLVENKLVVEVKSVDAIHPTEESGY